MGAIFAGELESSRVGLDRGLQSIVICPANKKISDGVTEGSQSRWGSRRCETENMVECLSSRSRHMSAARRIRQTNGKPYKNPIQNLKYNKRKPSRADDEEREKAGGVTQASY